MKNKKLRVTINIFFILLFVTIFTMMVVKSQELVSSTPYYVVTFQVIQAPEFLSKDRQRSIATEFELPVDKKLYDALQLYHILPRRFHIGKLLLQGDFAKYELKVVQKEVRNG